jgi:hypothetical protein
MGALSFPAPLPDHDADGRVTLIYEGQRDGAHRYWIDGQPRVEEPHPWTFAVEARATITGGARQVSRQGQAFRGLTTSGMWLMARNALAAGVLHDIVIEDVDAPRAACLWRQYGSSTAGLAGMRIERCRITAGRYARGVARGLFMGSGRISGLTIRQCTYEGAEPITDPGDIYGGITLAGKSANDGGAGFLFEDVELRGFRTAYADATRYRNADGIAVEPGYADGVIRRVLVADADDGGIDMKGRNWRIEHFTAERCARSVRRWSPGVDGPIASLDPTSAHVQAMACGEWVIEHVTARGAPHVPLVRFEDGASTVRILSWDVTGLDMSQQVLARRGDAPRGSCRLILPDGQDLIV